MNSFRRRTAWRIAMVSVALAAIVGPLTWFVSLHSAVQSAVALATEESRRLLRHHDAIALSGPQAVRHAEEAARTISGGLFDIAEIYDRHGNKLAESLTPLGSEVERLLPAHVPPAYRQATYESLRLAGDYWSLRIFVPLHSRDIDEHEREDAHGTGDEITGYFEGVRIIPPWQRAQITADSLLTTLLVCLASLLCGAAVYPVVVHLSLDNERKAHEVLESHIAMMGALGRAIAKRDSETGTHNYRVAWIATCLAERMGLAGQRMQALIAGSFLHDVGKIGVPDAILLKHGALDAQELSLMRTHVQQGEEIVAETGWLDGANAVVAGHHEKWDGSGYPRGLTGEAIPFEARIFAVADVFDALCSARPYKGPMAFDEVMAILESETGSHFDPAVMAAFRPLAREIFDRLASSSEEATRRMLEERVRHHFHL